MSGLTGTDVTDGDDPLIVGILQDMGLTENEAKVYMLLLSKGELTAQDLLRNLSLRQPQLYDITSSLERKGFINVIEERPKRFSAISAEAVIHSREEILRRSREFFLSWAERKIKSRRSGASLSSARNLKSLINNVIEIIGEAREFLEVETTLEMLSYFVEPLRKKEREGVRILLMIFGKSREILTDEYMELLQDLEEVRFISPGQFFTVIADETSSVFMPRNVALSSDYYRYGYIIRDRDMSWFISHNFFNGWYKAMTLKSREVSVPFEYTSQRIAVADLSRLLSIKAEVRCELEGKLMASGKKIRLVGKVTKVNINEDVINFVVQTDERLLTVGGYDSQIEDVEMTYLRLF